MPNQDPNDRIVYHKRTFWDRFKGWPLRVVLALLGVYLIAVIVSVIDQYFVRL